MAAGFRASSTVMLTKSDTNASDTLRYRHIAPSPENARHFLTKFDTCIDIRMRITVSEPPCSLTKVLVISFITNDCINFRVCLAGE